MTLKGHKRTMICQSCGIVAKR